MYVHGFWEPELGLMVHTILEYGCSGHLWGHLRGYHKARPQPQITHMAGIRLGCVTDMLNDWDWLRLG